MTPTKRIVSVACVECGAESEISEERLARGVYCDAEWIDDDGAETCGGVLMEYTPEPSEKQARQRGQG